MADGSREVVLEPALPLSRPLSDQHDDADSHSLCALTVTLTLALSLTILKTTSLLPVPCTAPGSVTLLMERLRELDSRQHLSTPSVASSADSLAHGWTANLHHVVMLHRSHA